jgi:c-di-GMP-binding flagellar brake protein YcgR
MLKYQTGLSGQMPQLTNVKDISAGGLRFLTKVPIDEGATVRLAILIPSFEKPIESEARVVRVECVQKGREELYSISVKFDKIESAECKALDEFIHELTKENKKSFFVDLPQLTMKFTKKAK